MRRIHRAVPSSGGAVYGVAEPRKLLVTAHASSPAVLRRGSSLRGTRRRQDHSEKARILEQDCCALWPLFRHGLKTLLGGRLGWAGEVFKLSKKSRKLLLQCAASTETYRAAQEQFTGLCDPARTILKKPGSWSKIVAHFGPFFGMGSRPCWEAGGAGEVLKL